MIYPVDRAIHPSNNRGLAFTADTLAVPEDLLLPLETAAAEVGLHLNAKETEFRTVNEDANHSQIRLEDGSQLKEVCDFK